MRVHWLGSAWLEGTYTALLARSMVFACSKPENMWFVRFSKAR